MGGTRLWRLLCNFFDRAFPVLAGMIGVTVEELMKAIAERGK